MRKDMQAQAIQMLEEAGFKNVRGYDNDYHLGLGIHEMEQPVWVEILRLLS